MLPLAVVTQQIHFAHVYFQYTPAQHQPRPHTRRNTVMGYENTIHICTYCLCQQNTVFPLFVLAIFANTQKNRSTFFRMIIGMVQRNKKKCWVIFFSPGYVISNFHLLSSIQMKMKFLYKYHVFDRPFAHSW